jgi:hypothetical protein
MHAAHIVWPIPTRRTLPQPLLHSHRKPPQKSTAATHTCIGRRASAPHASGDGIRWRMAAWAHSTRWSTRVVHTRHRWSRRRCCRAQIFRAPPSLAHICARTGPPNVPLAVSEYAANVSAATALPHQTKLKPLRCRYCPELTLATGGNSNYFESCANFIGSMHHWARGQPVLRRPACRRLFHGTNVLPDRTRPKGNHSHLKRLPAACACALARPAEGGAGREERATPRHGFGHLPQCFS